MTTDGTPSRKLRRILDDDDDQDDELPDVTDREFLNPRKPATARAMPVDDENDAGLFSDDDEDAEREHSGSPSRKRYDISD